MQGKALQILQENLSAYKKKYYLNVLLRGSIFFLACLLTFYLLFTSLEYYGRFNTGIRAVFLFSFIGISLYTLVRWIAVPLYKLSRLNEALSNEEASRQIGKFFPDISDRLLNTLQLSQVSDTTSDLIAASIEQRTKELNVIPFTRAVQFGENKKFLKYIAAPSALLLLLLIFIPQIFTEGTNRIVNFTQVFAEPAPFSFLLNEKQLKCFRHEDVDIAVRLEGNSIPEHIYFVHQGRKNKMVRDEKGVYHFTFRNIQKNESFYLEGAGFNSKEYNIEVISRPDLQTFHVNLHYPAYLNKKDESLTNAGNLNLPEGTEVQWDFGTADADQIEMLFTGSNKKIRLSSSNNSFEFFKKVFDSEEYQIQLFNGAVSSKEQIRYSINIVKDQYPQISVEVYKDTLLYNFVSLGGNLSDDYGLTRLRLNYRVTTKEKPDQNFSSMPIAVRNGVNSQTFYLGWKLDTLNLKPGEKLEYYMEVWDNDGVHGPKSSRSQTFEFKTPSKEEIQEQVDQTVKQAEKKMEQILERALDLQKDVDKFQEKIKTKNSLNWQDKKSLDDILNKHQSLQKDLEELQQLNEQLSEKQDKYNETSEELKEKLLELQKLMDELLDEETKELYEKLRKMLEQNMRKEDLQNELEKLEKNDQEMTQDLERTLELFKQAQFEQKMEDVKNDLQNLSKEQKELSEKTENKEMSKEELLQKQEELNRKFEEIQKNMEEAEDLNNSLEFKNEMPNTDQLEQEIQQNQENGSQQIQNGQNNKAGQSQKNAAQKMEEMSDKIEQSMAEEQMESMEQNMDDLKKILENLIKLSYDQESLMNEFRRINPDDPRYITLTQKQLELLEQSKIIEDSLIALSKKAPTIRTYVMRELNKMRDYMEESIETIKARRPDVISSSTGQMQFSMTSMNNLALLLSDALEQMQQQMAMAMQQKSGQGGSKACKKPGKGKPGSLGEWQKDLNSRMQQLMKSGASGKELSEGLAKLAAEQEMIRKALAEMEKLMQKQGNNGNNGMNQIKKEMEETETDLVNKRITQELLNRQQDILTRLLEAEKSVREREYDNTREATSAKDKEQQIPPSFEKYLKAKEKQVDLLKTIPPAMTPYFKEEVNEYFQKIEK